MSTAISSATIIQTVLFILLLACRSLFPVARRGTLTAILGCFFAARLEDWLQLTGWILRLPGRSSPGRSSSCPPDRSSISTYDDVPARPIDRYAR